MTKSLRAIPLVLFIQSHCLAQPISSFETEDEAGIIRPSGCEAERIAEHASEGEYSLRCTFPGKEEDSWPGLIFEPKEKDLSPYPVLAFDVFNPAQETVWLSWRIDDKDGNHLFDSAKLPPGKMTTVEIFTGGLAGHLDAKNITRIYPYVRCPRKDMVLYFDDFRFTGLNLDFKPLVYEETGVPAALTEEDRDRGYQIFSRHWLDVVFPGSRPGPSEVPFVLRAFATPGEYEPVTVSVYALRDLHHAAVTVSDLTSEDALIPCDAVSVYPVRCLNKRVTYPSEEYIQDMPVLLERRSSVSIDAGESRRFWLDIHVPTDAEPGIYRGVVVFRAEGIAEAELPIVLRVLPFRLEEPADMIWGEYYQGPKLGRTPEEKEGFLKRELEDMRAHGMTSVGLSMGVTVEQAVLTDEGVRLNLDSTSLYEQLMDLYRDLGFPAPVVQLADSGQAFAGHLPFMSDDYVRAYQSFWKAMQEECQSRGWPEIIVQPVDEPAWRDQEHRDRNVALLKLLGQIPGMRTEQDGPGDHYFHHVAGPHADVWNYNGSIADPEMIAEAQRDGHIIMLYNCDVESYRPEVGRYVAGFFQKRAGINGYYNWCYMSWNASPYNDLDHKTADFMHVYPPLGDEPGGPSTGWQGFREGIDDYKYIHTMESTANRAMQSGDSEAVAAGKAAMQKLDDLLATLSYSPRIRGTAEWTGMRVTPEGKYISGTLKLPNDWEFGTYDLARWRMAETTLAIMEALGEIPPQPDRPLQPTENGNRSLLGPISWETGLPRGSSPDAEAVRISIPVLEDAPTIDGDLSDAVWKRAAHIEEFELSTGGGRPHQQTRARLFVDDEALYVAFECLEDKIDSLRADVMSDGGPVWQDDCVEVFVDSNRDMRTYKQVIVNSLGKQSWNAPNQPGWRAQSEAAAGIGENAWYVELKIPLADLGLTSATLGLNLCRERRPKGVTELSCWSPTGGVFGRPDKFGVAAIGSPFFSDLRLSPGVLGSNTLSAKLTNRLHEKSEFAVVLESVQQRAAPTSSRKNIGPLPPDEAREFSLPYEITRDDGPVRLRLTLTNVTTDSEVDTLSFTQSVQPAVRLSVHPRICTLNRLEGALSVALAMDPVLTRETALQISLFRKGRQLPLRHQTVDEIPGRTLSAPLNVGGLPPGDYTLRSELIRSSDAGSPPIAHDEVNISKVRGPFD